MWLGQVVTVQAGYKLVMAMDLICREWRFVSAYIARLVGIVGV